MIRAKCDTTQLFRQPLIQCYLGRFLKKWANPGLFFIFQANNTIFSTNQCEKMSIQYTAPGFEPQPLKHESSAITTSTGFPPINVRFLPSCLHRLAAFIPNYVGGQIDSDSLYNPLGTFSQ